jgi:dolichyl-phosphate beta-glucosyltransferase
LPGEAGCRPRSTALRIDMLTLVIPCYNEADRLDQNTFVEFSKQNPDVHFLFVNDGSTDTTANIIASMMMLAGNRMKLLDLPENSGKAEAVRSGVLQALAVEPAGYVGYWDADLATPLAAIHDLMEAALTVPTRRFVCGSRILRMGARIERRWLRHYFGRIVATAASNVLDLPFYDTQCGAKLIEKDLAAQIFGQPFISRWLFDLELIARIIETLGRPEACGTIYEVPLTEWKDVGESRIKLSYLPRIPYELFRIRQVYRHSL